MQDAVVAGAGIGFVVSQALAHHPELAEVVPRRDVWSAPLWIVTHVDLHRTTKVQSFLRFLKDQHQDAGVLMLGRTRRASGDAGVFDAGGGVFCAGRAGGQ